MVNLIAANGLAKMLHRQPLAVKIRKLVFHDLIKLKVKDSGCRRCSAYAVLAAVLYTMILLFNHDFNSL